MASDPTQTPDADALARGYEARDVGVRAIVLLLGGFIVVFAGLCWGLWVLTNHELAVDKQPAGRSVVTKTRVGADAPPLQPSVNHESLDAWDLAKMRGQEDAIFKAMGWTMNERTHRYDVPVRIVDGLRARRTVGTPTTLPGALAPSPPAGEAKAQATPTDGPGTDGAGTGPREERPRDGVAGGTR